MDNTDNLLLPDSEQPTPRGGLGLGSIILLLGIIMVAVIFGLALARRNVTRPESGPAPDFTLTALDGSQIHLADLKGKVVVVNFWASWCGPCRQEAPALQTVWEQYKDKGVVVLGVAYTDVESKARDFIAEYGQSYPNGLDFGTKISDMYHITGVPETYFINRKGEVAETSIVPLTLKTLTDAVERVLGSNT